MLYIGLVIALLSLPALEITFVRRGLGSWSFALRSAMWLPTVAVLAIAAASGMQWQTYTGMLSMSWRDFGYALLAVLVVWAATGVHLAITDALRRPRRQINAAGAALEKAERQKTNLQQHILHFPFPHRCFLVLTVAVTEEVLFRAYGIGAGQHLLGSTFTATIISIAIFTLGHRSWGWSHLVLIFFISIILSALFLITNSLWACVIAHAILDGPSFLITPEYALRHSSQGMETNR